MAPSQSAGQCLRMLLRGICRWGSRSARLEVNVVLAILYAPEGQKAYQLRVLVIPDLLSAAAETAIHEAEELASVLRKSNSTLGRQIREGTSILNRLNWPSRFWAVGPSLAETPFDAGRRRASSDAAIAGYDAAVETHRQTTLTAFQQVGNGSGLRFLGQGRLFLGNGWLLVLVALTCYKLFDVPALLRRVAADSGRKCSKSARGSDIERPS